MFFGMSGKVVQPQLYIACGISGAMQYSVDMENSDINILPFQHNIFL
ncbi:MAG: FAD-binding protein [Promethearchaeota archaeon]